MAIEIKGYTHEEVAATKKQWLDARGEELKKQQNRLYAQELDLEAQKKHLQLDLNDYRIASVNRVLDFIRCGVERLEPSTIHTLLTHCMNKLNGNIDGIECNLKYDKPAVKEEA